MTIAKINNIFELGNNREEYFENPTKDYLNLDKKELNLIYANKKGSYIKKTPDHYGPVDSHGYVLVNGFNCQTRCEYCYLQSYLKSSDLVVFTNQSDYILFLDKFIQKFKKKYGDDQSLIFYDGDFKESLGYFRTQSNIQEINNYLNLLKNFPNTFLEIRTKNILEDFSIYDQLNLTQNLIVAITLGPDEYISRYEDGASDLGLRLKFAEYILSRGGNVSIRIDPIIIQDIDLSLDKYLDMIDNLDKVVGIDRIYDWGIGVLRLKENLYKTLKKRGSDLCNNMIFEKGFWKYPQDVREKVYSAINNKLGNAKVYMCME